MYPEADWKPWAFDAIGYLGGGGGANSMVVEKTPRPDLTRRQLEWCRDNLGFIPLPPARVRDQT